MNKYRLVRIAKQKSLWSLESPDWLAVWNAENMRVSYLPLHSAWARDLSTIDISDISGYETSSEHKQRTNCTKPDIYAMKLIVTERCNLYCSYCFVRNQGESVTNADMSNKTIELALQVYADHLKKSKCPCGMVNIYGGEPLLARGAVKHILKTIASMRINGRFDRPIEIVLETNGTILDESLAEMLARSHATVVVSLDGPEEQHNACRMYDSGRGSYSEAVAGYWQAHSSGATTVVSSVLGTHNINHLEKVVSFVKEKLQCSSLGMNMQHPMSDGRLQHALASEQLVKAYIMLLEAGAKHGVYIEQAFRRLRPFVEEQYRLRDCPSAGRRIVVRPDGMAGVCEAVCLQTSKGLIHVSYLPDFTEHETFQQWYQRTPRNLPDCVDCPAGGICGAGCSYNAIALHGTVNAVDQRFCNICQAILEWCIRELAQRLNVSARFQASEVIYTPTIAEKRVLYGNAPVSSEKTPLWAYSTHSEERLS